MDTMDQTNKGEIEYEDKTENTFITMAKITKPCNGTGPVTRSNSCRINESSVRTKNSKAPGVGPKTRTSTNKKDGK
ncbi:MAG: hypothetical protein J6M55_05395 [Paludibacteraceae bacterium]|nr:hypothetical protein [Paludibacteraceae bacterium]